LTKEEETTWRAIG